MENDIIFRKASFGGFEREDVMNYISQITDEFHEKLEKKEKELALAKEEAEKLSLELESLKSENKELNEKISKLEKEKTEKEEAAVEENIEDTEQLKAAVKALTQKVDELINDAAEKKNVSDNDTVGYDRDLFDIIEQYTD